MSNGSHGEIVTLDVVYLTTSGSIRKGGCPCIYCPEKGRNINLLM